MAVGDRVGALTGPPSSKGGGLSSAGGGGVGDIVGDATGLLVGDEVGLPVGDAVGLPVGDAVGLLVGDAVGLPVGDAVGLPVGDAVGLAVGAVVGLPLGDAVGLPVGDEVGLPLGDAVGLRLGADVGPPVGAVVGVAAGVGAAVGAIDGAIVGAIVGLRDCAIAGVGATMLLTIGRSSDTLPVSPSRRQIWRREIRAWKGLCGPSSRPAFDNCASARCTISSSAGSFVSAAMAAVRPAIDVSPSACRQTLAAAALSSCTRSECSSNNRQSPSKSLTMMSSRRALGCIQPRSIIGRSGGRRPCASYQKGRACHRSSRLVAKMSYRLVLTSAEMIALARSIDR